MRAIKITAETGAIEEIEIDGLADMQAAVGGYLEAACDTPDGKNTLYVDEEGLMKENEHFILYCHGHAPYAGNGLFCGFNSRSGKTVDCKMSLDEVKKDVRFITRTELILAQQMSKRIM